MLDSHHDSFGCWIESLRRSPAIFDRLDWDNIRHEKPSRLPFRIFVNEQIAFQCEFPWRWEGVIFFGEEKVPDSEEVPERLGVMDRVGWEVECPGIPAHRGIDRSEEERIVG